MYDAGGPTRRKSLPGFALPASCSVPFVVPDTSWMPVACSTVAADDTFTPPAPHSCTLIGIVLPDCLAPFGPSMTHTLYVIVIVSVTVPLVLL